MPGRVQVQGPEPVQEVHTNTAVVGDAPTRTLRRKASKKVQAHLPFLSSVFTIMSDLFGGGNRLVGTISGAASEHELLLQLARDALKDAGSPDVSKRCGIVSGCLSFPRDGMQRVLQREV